MSPVNQQLFSQTGLNFMTSTTNSCCFLPIGTVLILAILMTQKAMS